jgi:hypothetical protein
MVVNIGDTRKIIYKYIKEGGYKMIRKVLFTLLLSLLLLIPNMVDAAGFRGGSSSRSSGSFSSHGSSYSGSSHGSSYSGSSARRSSSSSSSTKSSTSKSSSFSGGSSTKGSTSKSSSFSGGSSTKSSSHSPGGTSTKSTTNSYQRSGSFSGRTSTVTGKVYSGNTTKGYYRGRPVSVHHYYHAGYSPFGWFGYYHGFTMGMFMGSMFHPWGATYYSGGHYTNYGPSPLAWIIDVILLILVIYLLYAFVRRKKSGKTIYTRRF